LEHGLVEHGVLEYGVLEYGVLAHGVLEHGLVAHRLVVVRPDDRRQPAGRILVKPDLGRLTRVELRRKRWPPGGGHPFFRQPTSRPIERAWSGTLKAGPTSSSMKPAEPLSLPAPALAYLLLVLAAAGALAGRL